MNEPEVMLDMLGGPERAPRTIAVVGISDNEMKPSFYVSAAMQARGFAIRPINPGLAVVLGERCYGSLGELPENPDVVNVFRLPKFIPGVVEEMIELGIKNLWVQQGIVNLAAARSAESAGIRVVMDRCIMVEERRLR